MHQMIRSAVAMLAAVLIFNLGACTFGVGNDDGNVGDASINGDTNNVPDRPAPNCVPRLEVCNGYDDDCDGIVDNNIASQEATPDCTDRNAVMVCINGGWQCQAPMSEQPDSGRPPPADSGTPGSESCVNGYAPEVCTPGTTSTALAQCDTFCTRQCGEGSTRHLSCGSNSRWSCSCDSTPTPDAGVTPTDSGSPSGETCIDGHAPTTCTPGATSTTLAMCDSFCTGRCGAGSARHLFCGPMGTWNCWCDTTPDAGVTPTPDASVPTCTAREEIFNGMDDDCDGMVDEGTTRSPQSACISSCASASPSRYADRENYTGAGSWYCACGGLIPVADAGVADSGTSPAGSRFVYEVRLADRWLPGLTHISLRDKWFGEIPCEEGSSGGFHMSALPGNWYRCTTTVRLPAFTVAFWHDGRTSCTESTPCSTSPTFAAPVNCNNVEGTYRVYELRPAPDGRRFDIFTDASQPVRERVDGFCRHRDTGAGPL